VPAEAQDGFVNFPHIEDELNSARVSTALEIDAGRVNRVEFGLSYSDREKQKVDNGTFLTLQDFPGTTAIPAEFLLPDTSLDFIGMGSMVSYDSYGLWKSGFYRETSENLTVATRSINTWTVNEKIAIAYAKAGFDVDIGPRSLGGNFGLQLVQTDQSSDGFAVGLDDSLVVSEPNSGGDKFTDVLPSLNTSFHLSDTQQIRFGAARVLSRSRMDRMNASYGYTFDVSKNVPGANPETSPWSGNGANPTLRPQKSDQFDLSYENYFNREGYFSIGAFYKDLKNWQTTVNEVVDFSGIAPPGGVVAQYNLGLVSTWVNSDGGSVSGAEFQAAIPAGLFTPALEGFGALVAATYLESKISVNGEEAPVPGLSKNIYNVTLYYEQRGFGARLSGSKRSAFLGEVYSRSFVRTFVNVNGTELLDAQLSYDFSQSEFDRLRGLKIMLQAQNLTNEPLSTYELGADPRLVRDFQNYGTNYLLGFSYKF
jgi:iron complex outermembrane receptor protein